MASRTAVRLVPRFLVWAVSVLLGIIIVTLLVNPDNRKNAWNGIVDYLSRGYDWLTADNQRMVVTLVYMAACIILGLITSIVASWRLGPGLAFSVCGTLGWFIPNIAAQLHRATALTTDERLTLALVGALVGFVSFFLRERNDPHQTRGYAE